MKDWTAAAATMAGGQPVGGGAAGAQLAPPDDTGEALDLTPANLTVTFGFGPKLFDDRFGLSRQKPPKLTALPDLPGDALDRDRSDGDLCVQACANDPQVAFHAIRNLARIGRGLVTVRWSQLGFGRTSTTSRAQATPRNLMGFKDGTANIKLEDAGELERSVWVGGDAADEPAWLRERLLPRRAPHPDADRGLGPRLAARPGGRRSAAPRSSARRSAAPTSSRR